MANQQFQDLDFDEIKENLKTYLTNKSEYADHNFSGSTWNLLLDVMAWTTHYVGVYANLALSESFLDSADLRRSIVSRAKELGYFPKQSTAAQAGVQLSVTGQTSGLTLYVPTGAKFSASIDAESFLFQSIDKIQLIEDGSTGNYATASDVIIKQGFSVNKTWTISDPATDQFVIVDSNIDTDTLTVTVNNEEWLYADDITVATPDSKIFYLQEVDVGEIEIYFGDDILGANIDTNDKVVATWLNTKADRANNINVFELTSPIGGIAANAFTIITTSQSSGGSEPESDETIKLIAPKVYATQNRLVTAEDYESMVLAEFSYIDAISVWGGEESSPPQYGKILISVSKSGIGESILTTVERAEILDYISLHKVVTQRPEIYDPDYLNISMAITTKYNQYMTTKSDDDLVAAIEAGVEAYYNSNLVNFNSTLRMSRLLAAIDNSETSIVDSHVDLTIHKKWQQPILQFQLSQTIAINFGGNAIEPGTFTSSLYDTTKQLKDDGEGNVLYYDNLILLDDSFGTIDYITGTINIPNITIPDATAAAALVAAHAGWTTTDDIVLSEILEQERLDNFEVIKFYMQPSGYNVITSENNLIARDSETVVLELLTRDD